MSSSTVSSIGNASFQYTIGNPLPRLREPRATCGCWCCVGREGFTCGSPRSPPPRRGGVPNALGKDVAIVDAVVSEAAAAALFFDDDNSCCIGGTAGVRSSRRDCSEEEAVMTHCLPAGFDSGVRGERRGVREAEGEGETAAFVVDGRLGVRFGLIPVTVVPRAQRGEL